jgi:enamine deaminase RidA (YjgF/YER057c/UK114 family)
VRQAFQNTVDVLEAAGAKPEHLVRMTWFITDREAYSAAGKEIGEAYLATIGKHFPAMTVVEVSRLLVDDALVEIESAAVVPND